MGDGGAIGADTEGPGVSGGCGCRTSSGQSTSGLPWLLGLVGLLAYRRRR
jgi:MYXO-CTERM domain-containing protein